MDPIIPMTKPAVPAPGDADSGSTAPGSPSGAATVDHDVALEGEILAHQSLDKIARMIALEVKEAVLSESDTQTVTPRILFLQPGIAAAFRHHQAFVLATDHLEAVFQEVAHKGRDALQAFQTITEEDKAAADSPVNTALGVATAATSAIAGIAGLFRQDVTIKGLHFPPSQAAFENSVSRSLLRVMPQLELRNPRLLVFRPARTTQLSHGRLLDRLRRVEVARSAAASAVQMIGQRVLELQFAIDPPFPAKPPEGAGVTRLQAELAVLKPSLGALSGVFADANDRWDNLVALLAGLPPKSEAQSAKSGDTAAVLGAIQIGEELVAWFQQGGPDAAPAWLLSLEVISVRANFKTRKGVFTNLGGKDSESYSGAAIATYALLDGEACIRVSGTHRFRTPYLKFEGTDASPGDGNSFDETFHTTD